MINYNFYYGYDEEHLKNVTEEVYSKCIKNNKIVIEINDSREYNHLFGDPFPGVKKRLKVILPDIGFFKYFERTIILPFEIVENKELFESWNIIKSHPKENELLKEYIEYLKNIKHNTRLYEIHVGYGGGNTNVKNEYRNITDYIYENYVEDDKIIIENISSLITKFRPTPQGNDMKIIFTKDTNIIQYFPENYRRIILQKDNFEPLNHEYIFDGGNLTDEIYRKYPFLNIKGYNLHISHSLFGMKKYNSEEFIYLHPSPKIITDISDYNTWTLNTNFIINQFNTLKNDMENLNKENEYLKDIIKHLQQDNAKIIKNFRS